MQNRKENNSDLASSISSGGKKKPLSDKLENPNIDDINETANINDLDDYIEMLYEDDVKTKIRGSALVLQLARNPDNLEELFQSETILNCLQRVLKEEWRRNIEVTTNLVYIFFCFSSFSQFHPLISHFKIGNLTLQIVEFELNRCETWQAELERRTKGSAANSTAKNSNSNRPKTSSRGGGQNNMQFSSPENEKIVRDLKSYIFKNEQLLRSKYSLFLLINYGILRNWNKISIPYFYHIFAVLPIFFQFETFKSRSICFSTCPKT